jgi:hypothetical protein
MKRLTSILGIAIALGVTLAAGVIQGHLSNRWGITNELKEAGKRLEQCVPSALGKWRLKSQDRLGETSARMLQSVGQFVATYENEESGEEASVFVIVGPMGPTAEHTPEVCFSSRAFRQVGGRARVALQSSDKERFGQFWMATFESKSLEGGYVRSYWAWSPDGKWSAPDNARTEFVRSPYLYKIQVQSVLRAEPSPDTPDPCREFLMAFLPAARKMF